MPSPASDLTMRGTKTFEPPYDDEASNLGELTSGSLALALSLARSDAEPPTLRLLTGGRTKPAPARRKPRTAKQEPVPATQAADLDGTDDDPTFGGQRTARADLPSPKVFGARLVQALSEATAGERPLGQLSPYLSRAVYHRLERHFAATVRGTGSAGQDNRANVRSVRVCEPRDGVAELAAVVRRGGRMAAIALRLEGVDGRWQCTALHIG